MQDSGMGLERLVEAIEKHFVPEGFAVEVRRREFNDAGQVTAEFDVVVSGPVGTTDMKWLIECRDRPSQGAAPTAWIEQLVGRRDRFHFSKVTAVSTTGFSPDAVAYASRQGIELRGVETLTREAIANWFLADELQVFHRKAEMTRADIFLDPGTEDRDRDAASAIVASATSDMAFLRNPAGKLVSVNQVWSMTVNQNAAMFDGIHVGAPPAPSRILLSFPNAADRFTIKGARNEVPIVAIGFHANLSLSLVEVPISQVTRYSVLDTGRPLAESARFKLHLSDQPVEVGIHKMLQTGEIVVSIRGSSAAK